MKKIIKISVLSLMLMVMMTGLTGCRKFEQMRKNQAVKTEKGNIIVWETTYLPLPECDYLNPDFEYGESAVYLTTEEVPVLLSGILGETLEVSKDEKFLLGTVNIYGNYYNQVYCREDIYDEVKTMIEEAYVPAYYECRYYDWKADEMKAYVFSEEEANAMKSVLAGEQGEACADLWESMEIFSCVEGLPLSKAECELIASGGLDGGTTSYYLVVYGAESDAPAYHKVPAELEPVFKNIIDNCSLKEYS